MAGRSNQKAVNESAAEAQQTDGGTYLDPELAKLRDQEAARLGQVEVSERAEPTIDPELEKQRDAELAALNEDGTVKVTDYTVP